MVARHPWIYWLAVVVIAAGSTNAGSTTEGTFGLGLFISKVPFLQPTDNKSIVAKVTKKMEFVFLSIILIFENSIN